MIFRIAADAVLLLHALFVFFVVASLPLVFIGKARGWSWVRNPWFRLAHLLAIAIVVVQAWIGILCPLTTFEMMLRARAGDTVYAGSFVAHWLERLLYHQWPPWVFVAGYTAFGGLVVAGWIRVRPRSITGRRQP